MTTQGVERFSRFFELPEPLRVKICSYTPVTDLSFVSRAFRALNVKTMEREWKEMRESAVLKNRVWPIREDGFTPLYLQTLWQQQKELAYRTCGGFNAFRFEAFCLMQREERGSYAVRRFEKVEPIIASVDKEQEVNLTKIWFGSRLPGANTNARGIGEILPGLLGPLAPQTVEDIRAWMNDPAHQPLLDQIAELHIPDLGLSALPFELIKCRRVERLLIHSNYIRELPAWVDQFTKLKTLDLDHNRFDQIPPVLLRMPQLFQGVITTGVFLTLPNNCKVLTEEVYDFCFTWEHWLGRPFDYPAIYPNQKWWIQYGYLFGYKPENRAYGEGYIRIEKYDLQEIPFALWLREELRVDNYVANILQKLDWRPSDSCFDQMLIALAWGSVIFFGILIWPINRFLSFAIVPIVTKIRELLGYGRMIRIKGEGA